MKNKLTHFFINKKYTLYFINEKNEEVYFISFEEKQNIIKSLNKLLAIINIKVLDIFYLKTERSNFIYYSANYVPDESSKEKLARFIKYIIKKNYDYNISFNLVNLFIPIVNSAYLKCLNVEKIVSKAVREKRDLVFPPYLKKGRKKVRKAIKCYSNFQLKTEGIFGEKKVIAIYKKRD